MLDGRVFLITGAKGGLGTFVTQAFLGAGAKVAGSARSIVDTDFSHRNFAAFEADIGSREHARALVGKVLSQWTRIDGLVHLAGGYAGGQTVSETDDATLERMFDMNLRPFFYVAGAVLPAMQRQRAGSILAIGSRTAVDPAAMLGAYSASKAALVSMVRTIALENKQFGISANAILPGTMDTPANRTAMPGADVKQWVQPDQVASMLVHLASSSNVTGAVIPIYGGEL